MCVYNVAHFKYYLFTQFYQLSISHCTVTSVSVFNRAVLKRLRRLFAESSTGTQGIRQLVTSD